MFFGHWYELLVVLVIALIFFGPKRLPELGSSLGKGIREFRKATTELQDTLKAEPTESLPPERPAFTPEHTQYSAGAPTATQTHTAEYTAPGTPAAPVHSAEHEPPRA